MSELILALDRMAFALAGPRRGLGSARADLILFLKDRMQLKKSDRTIQEWSYGELERLRYTHFRRWGGGFSSFWMGGMNGGREARLEIRSKGESLELAFELDLEYRTAELRRLFEEMYCQGIPLYEYSHAGVERFLLEPLRGEDRKERLRDWLSSQPLGGRNP